MVKILIKKTNKEVITPKYKTDGSSGVDLSAFLDKEVVINSIKNKWMLVVADLEKIPVNLNN